MSSSNEKHYNLLKESLFQVKRSGEEERGASLTEVLSELGGSGSEIDFTHLRPFQQHAWFAFLVQLATMALISSNRTEPSNHAAAWEKMLLELTSGNDEPWCLFVEDLSKPAFMQPPVPEGRIDEKWKAFNTPGTLDLLVTGKNHDVKTQLINSADPDHWCYALISLQTMEGFSGRNNYGIARMNSGFGSRPCVTLATAPDWNSRFVRDVPILLKNYDRMLSGSLPYTRRNGYKLLWLLPWDGEESIDLSGCDPFFIEICRRIRLTYEHGVLKARGTSTSTARIAGEELHGVTGDPWTPVDKNEAKALTVSAAGFDYRKLHQLLFPGDYEKPITWRQDDDRGSMHFIASALTRGQGKTEGYHYRELLLPEPVIGMLKTREGGDMLAKFSQSRIERCQQVRNTVLNRALCLVAQGAPKGKLDFRDSKTNQWLVALDRNIDAIFFDRLFSQLELDPEAADIAWIRELLTIAEDQLDDALRSIPQPTLRRFKVESAARRMFHGMVRDTFPELFINDDVEGKSNEGAANV
ncbi:MAG: hypothetical protein JXA64_09410 [Candidatus Fermentibacteraceae bacterium]|nr:hypothetical protein [Candidatus Fermentibacteraceae bacterium]MBN2609316.1 hypothetical protein [Candidatus Fermentibacteraceae bacterium]